MNKLSVTGGSCPVGLDKTNQCKTLVTMPPFSACSAFKPAFNQQVVLAKENSKTPIDIAKDVLKNVPFDQISSAFDSA